MKLNFVDSSTKFSIFSHDSLENILVIVGKTIKIPITPLAPIEPSISMPEQS